MSPHNSTKPKEPNHETFYHRISNSRRLGQHAALAADRTVTVAVKNMTCVTCVPTIKKSLNQVKGVKRVAVSVKTKTAKVVYDDKVTTVSALVKATTNGLSVPAEKLAVRELHSSEREGPSNQGAEWLSRSCCGAGDATWLAWIVMAQPFVDLLIFGVLEYAGN